MAEYLRAYVARQTLFAFCIIGIVVTFFTTALRIWVRINKQRRLHPDDYALFTAVVFYWTLAVLYIVDLPYLYAFLDYSSGQSAYSPELPEKYHHMMMVTFVVTALFWAVLWLVKISLLLFFRRVIRGTEWMRAWWFIMGLTIITFVGCIISELLSCDTIADFTKLGACVSPSNQRSQVISLYYSFAADVVTELAVLALPLRVVLTLRMSRRDKFALAALFSVGFISITVSMIRVFLIWAKTHSTTPSVAWLGLWAVIECMVAIIVGCIPAISQAFRVNGRTASGSDVYDGHYIGGKPTYIVSADKATQSRGLRGTSKVPGVSSSEEYLDPGYSGIQCQREVEITTEAGPNNIEMPKLHFDTAD